MLVAYVYFLSISVYAVVTRRSAEKETTVLSAKISLLESQYVALDKRINLDLAHAQGFVDVTIPRYISHEGTHDTLTLREGALKR